VVHARAKALSGSHAVYYVPAAIVEPLLAVKAGFEAMDGNSIPMNIVPVVPSDEIMVAPTIKVRVFETEHRVSSQGYALYTISAPKLLPEYQCLHPKEIGELKKSGIPIFGPAEEHLDMVYTGDTTFQGLLRPSNSFIFHAPVLIMELTYLDRDVSKALQHGHVHIQDIIDNEHVFFNDQIVFVHLSQKYNIHTAMQFLRTKLPHSIAQRAKVSLRSFGASEVLTNIVERKQTNHSHQQRQQRYEPGHPHTGSSHRVHYHQGQKQGQPSKRSFFAENV
jgi:hypothetical protein